jgi:hypothetical protein
MDLDTTSVAAFLTGAFLVSWVLGYTLGLKILMIRKAVDTV